MTRVSLAVDEQAGYPEAGTALSFVASDPVNGNSFEWTGRETMFARNTDASPQTVQFAYHRRGQLITQAAVTLAAGETRCFGPMPFEMTEHSPSDEMTIYVTTSDADVLLAVRMLKQGNIGIDPNLVLWLDAADYSGSGQWLDQSGNENHVTWANAPTHNGQYFTFDGANDYGVIADDDTLDLPGDFTIEFWYAPNANNDGLMAKSDWSAPEETTGWQIETTTYHRSGISPAGYSQIYRDETTAPALLAWAHVLIIRSGTTVRSYRNNVLEYTFGFPTPDSADYTNALEMRIGMIYKSAANNFYDGDLALVRIYDDALTSDERAENYAEFVARGL